MTFFRVAFGLEPPELFSLQTSLLEYQPFRHQLEPVIALLTTNPLLVLQKYCSCLSF